MTTSALNPSSSQPLRESAESALLRLATPVLQIALQLKANECQPDGATRQKIREHLLRLETEGAQKSYREQQLRDTKFALAALIDQTVLTGSSPLQNKWRGDLLVVEYFGDVNAGNIFFDRLDEMLRASKDETDVLEIYYHCLLLGYRGRYLVSREQELPTLVAKVANHLYQAGRLRPLPLASRWQPPDRPGPPVRPGWPRWAQIGYGAWLWAVILLFIVLSFWLKKDLIEMVKQNLLRD